VWVFKAGIQKFQNCKNPENAFVMKLAVHLKEKKGTVLQPYPLHHVLFLLFERAKVEEPVKRAEANCGSEQQDHTDDIHHNCEGAAERATKTQVK